MKRLTVYVNQKKIIQMSANKLSAKVIFSSIGPSFSGLNNPREDLEIASLYLSSYPNSLRAWIEKGNALKLLQRFSGALESYREVPKLISTINSSEELGLLACAFFNIANLESSIQKYSDYKNNYIDCIHYGIKSKNSFGIMFSAMACFELGLWYNQENNFTSSIHMHNRAVKVGILSNSPEGLYITSRAYFNIANYEGRSENYNRFEKLMKKSIEYGTCSKTISGIQTSIQAYQSLLSWYESKDNTDEKEKIAQQIRDYNIILSNTSESHKCILEGQDFESKDQIDKARISYRKAIDLSKSLENIIAKELGTKAAINLAQIIRKKSRSANLIEKAYIQIIELGESTFTPWSLDQAAFAALGIGSYLDHKGKAKDAKKYYKKASKLAKTSTTNQGKRIIGFAKSYNSMKS